jgi:hypothetical protein
VCAFIDCNCLECPRPGGGPAVEGEDALRWDPAIQQSFCNGWKSVHGLKHQTVDCAYGMTIDMHGPWSLRRNDNKLLRESCINKRFREMQNGAMELTMYGDSIYPRLSHLSSCWKDPDEAWKRDENRRYSSVRINIEWNYMVTGNLYKYLRNHEKLKLTTKFYTVATILRNAHVALYGSITSNYFDLVIPQNFLEKYFQLPGF